ncbi:hypothetical protein NM688_g4488 [Phlebia brevispora]|uniref:Uncharacterized protein n=1 Tax=Phlebia brevispora TaxID=194682 RepID=A0ACC1T2T8_9APHY|nr:hypothetical protein NM688_g4488 [Phlebia brevispora]
MQPQANLLKALHRTRLGDELTETINSRLQRMTKLRDEHSRIHLEVCELKTRKNRIALVSRVPAEVLSLIFEAYVALYWSEFLPPDEKVNVFFRLDEKESVNTERPYAWFAILHVCHDWRRVALSTPGIWTTIIPARPECVRFMLAHAGRLSLTIHLNCRPKGGLERQVRHAYRIILRHLARMRAAQLRITDAVYAHLTIMEDKELVGHELMFEELMVEMTKPHEKVSVLSTAQMPRLVSLAVRQGSPAVLDSLCRRATLTSLVYSSNKDTFTSLGALTSTLSQLPLLQHLDLTFDLIDSDAGPEELTPPHIAHFPSLESLSLASEIDNLRLLLKYLMFPQDTSVALRVVSSLNDELTQQAIASFADKVLHSDAPASGSPLAIFRPRRITIDSDPNLEGFEVMLSQWPEGMHPPSAPSHPRLHIDFRHDYEIKMEAELLSWLLGHFDLSGVEAINAFLDVPAATWFDILHRQVLPEVGSIRLRGRAAEELLLASITPLGSTVPSLANSPQQYLFPNLKALLLDSVLMRRKPRGPTEGDLSPRLRELLKRRTGLFGKLKKLVFDRCYNMSDADILALTDPDFADSCEIYRRLYCDDDQDSQESDYEWGSVDDGDVPANADWGS